jgi:hypothetical protein
MTPDGQDVERRRAVERELDRWTGPAKAPRYDSVVIVGGHGVTTHTFAARLARHERLAGRVVLAGPPAREDRRLKAGVSLRGYAADFIAYALGVGLQRLVDEVTPGHFPVATRQTVCMADTATGKVAFSRVGPWQNHRGRRDRPIVFGFRNSATVAAIQALTGGVTIVPEAPTSLDEARDLAPGTHPLLVDATRAGDLVGGRATSGWGIAAAQVPFSAPAGIDGGPLDERTALAPLVRRDGRIDVGYYTPFADRLTAAASWYGIMARAIDMRSEGDRRERELELLTEELLAIGSGCGLQAIDPDETLGQAWVPAPPWTAPEARDDNVFDLRRACTPGISAYYADGMTGSAVAGTAAAEAVIRGTDPAVAAARALRPLRRWNWVWWVETVKMPWIADRLTRLSPPLALSWPHSTSVRRWSSAA